MMMSIIILSILSAAGFLVVMSEDDARWFFKMINALLAVVSILIAARAMATPDPPTKGEPKL
jgi:hypothetical protein